MATIRMTHPEHGYHTAGDLAEVDRLEKAGWKRISDKEFREVLAAKAAALAAEQESEEVEEEVVRKPGRPKK